MSHFSFLFSQKAQRACLLSVSQQRAMETIKQMEREQQGDSNWINCTCCLFLFSNHILFVTCAEYNRYTLLVYNRYTLLVYNRYNRYTLLVYNRYNRYTLLVYNRHNRYTLP